MIPFHNPILPNTLTLPNTPRLFSKLQLQLQLHCSITKGIPGLTLCVSAQRIAFLDGSANFRFQVSGFWTSCGLARAAAILLIHAVVLGWIAAAVEV
ncbi:hypothetical protein KC19_VG166900 [Ceratodon purpureus]|uniref:Uncharacterized protein n=1 Tax=Ceratodon purpureus TaxID=3225 RepID=A0A8T0HRV6_CERPU|nr:hypothetical protein KC19_VG166900 [Ceratodon purpureus]